MQNFCRVSESGIDVPGLTQALRRIIVGERLPTARAMHERLPKLLALPVFASDAVSSSAYATEEILLALVLAGTAALRYSIGIGVAICILFAVVAISYRQTVLAYPSGGGAYVVARENLGFYPGLIAAAALMTDYVLTVAVSIAAGVAAIVSAAPGLEPYRVSLCLFFIAFITIANLRGLRESGRLFAGPTYLFVGTMVVMLLGGAVKQLLSPGPVGPVPLAPPMQSLTLFLVLRAFASGCAALTGIEAISNSVPAFQPPESRNAAATLLWMMVICIGLFIGITVLAQLFHIAPHPEGTETVVSQLAHRIFGSGFLYYLLQAATALILLLAANTSFNGFPRLASVMARDGVAPRQLANLGDRLVFSNGILLLGAAAAVLILIFGGMTHALIPLYAVGVFISFTLSQAGMVRRWQRLRTPGWRVSMTMNAVGAVATAVVLVVVAAVKFSHGAWIVLIFIPILVLAFLEVTQHYRILAAQLSLEGYDVPRALNHEVLVLVPGLHRGVVSALLYAKSIAAEPEGVFVEIDPEDTPKIQEEWYRLRLGMPLTVLRSPWRSLTDPVIQYIRTVRAERHVDLVTVVIPEFATTRWWHGLLHNQSGLLLKFALMSEPGVVVTNVRYHVEE
jgi:amino acid transporter